MKRICVIDGQGGGIGATLIKYLKEAFGESVELIGLGTNAIATAQMLKAGANRGASGENAIVHTVGTADLVVGPISISWANAMLGEVTPKMAEAVMSCRAPKILLPLTQEPVILVGMVSEPLPHLVQRAVNEKVRAYMLQDDKENLILESVDLVKPHDDGGYLLVDIFGTQKIVQGRLKQMNLVDHRIIFEAS